MVLALDVMDLLDLEEKPIYKKAYLLYRICCVYMYQLCATVSASKEQIVKQWLSHTG